MSEKATKIIPLLENRKARHNYAIEDTFECGLMLLGWEVKSLRERRANFADAYALLKGGEVFILGLRIDPYKQSTHEILEPERTRKLLLNKKEIIRLERMLQNKKATLVPLKIYLKNNRLKLLIGIGVGKTLVDKRRDIKERETKEQLRRVLKRG
jgi:SsrA-binding protein